LRFDQLAGLWLEGQRRLRDSEPRVRASMERAVEALVDELRRRLGGPFTVDELAELYQRDGTDWCFSVAMRAAPGDPEAWDVSTLSGAAFARYARDASDYTLGRRIGDFYPTDD
jgi:hypothetical protein